MNAIVLAGGFGSRLKPLTDSCPKPMLKVANRPMIDYVVAQLYHYGIYEMVFTLGYKPKQVEEFVSSYRGVKSEFSVETEPLGTAGGVKKAADKLDEIFVVVSGDALSNIDLGKMVAKHIDSGAAVTLAATTVENPKLYGVIALDGSDTVTRLIEKPDSDEYGNLVNAGVYVMNKSVLDRIPNGIPFDFSRDLFPQLVQSGELKAYLHNGYWCDIGDKTSYYRANFFMKRGGFYDFVPSFMGESFTSREENGSLVSAGAVTVGKFNGCIIGKDARVASSADLTDCIVLDGATALGQHRNAIIGTDFVEELPQIGLSNHAEVNYYRNLLFGGV